LAEILVFGARAGRSAAAFAKANPLVRTATTAGGGAEAARDRIRELFARDTGGDTVSGLRKAMNDTMESGAGIYRSQELLLETCRVLADLRRRYRKVRLEDRSNVFNTDLIQVLELGSMLDVAEALAHSALQRKESRGSHQRLDHVSRDDGNFLKHSLATYRGDEAPAVTYCDVVITRSQPAERIYGGAAA
jgi:fumarate reductase flavoprotein subunit